MPGTCRGVEPAPTPTSTEPTSELAGQLGEACSALPVLAGAAAIAASEQIETPASFASRPWGRIVSTAFSCWVPSALVSFRKNGVKTLTVGLIVPAEKVGALGACAFGPAGAAVGAGGEPEGAFEFGVGAGRRGPRGEQALAHVPATVVRRLQRRSRAREEFDAEVFDWQLGVVPEAERDPAGAPDRVRSDRGS